MRRRLIFRLVSFAVFICTGLIANAQETAKEFWPEVDMWYRHSAKWRYSLFIPISKNIETKYREGGFILQADYAFGKPRHLYFRRLIEENRSQFVKPFLARGGYLSGRSLDDKGEAYNENMLFLELHARTPLKRRYLISHRVRTEGRWIGDDNDFSMRFRYRFMAEKDISIKKVSLVPFVNVEPYYDTRYATFNRFRAIGGATVSWIERFAIEGNFTYQHDTRSSVTNLYAVNIILHVFFERKNRKEDVP